MTTQPEALRLADEIDGNVYESVAAVLAAAELRRLHEREKVLEAQILKNNPLLDEAAAEIDRLHAANQELLEALTNLANVFQEGQVFPRNQAAGYVDSALEAAEAAIAKHGGSHD